MEKRFGGPGNFLEFL